MRRFAIASLAIASAMLAGGCSEGSAGPDTPQVARVVLSGVPAALSVGQSVQLAAAALAEDGQSLPEVPLSWQVSNPAIATVSATGMLSGVSPGSALVWAFAAGHADTAPVVVTPAPIASITLAPGGDTLAIGQSVTLVPTALDAAGRVLTGRTFSYSSGNANVTTVAPSGQVTAVGLGTTEIQVTSEGISSSAWIFVPQCSATAVVAFNSWALPVQFGGTIPSGNLTASGRYKVTEVLYGAGVVVGISAADTKTGYEPASATSDFPSAPVCLLPDAAFSRTYSKLQISPTLQVTQETIAYPGGAAANYVLFRYSVKNTSASALSGLVVGFIGDWDLSFDNFAGDDLVRRSTGISGGEALEPDSISYPQVVGIVSIAQSGTFGYEGWSNGAAATRADFYSFLSRATPSTATVRGDVRQLVGRGGLTLAAGAHQTFYFAIVGGDTRSAFNASVNGATVAANTILGFP
jgi:hypothetical protein